MITMQDYQVRAHETAEYKDDDKIKALAYHIMRMNGKAGTLANLLTETMLWRQEEPVDSEVHERVDGLQMSMYTVFGDILWYIAESCNFMDWNLSELARANLANRKQMVEEAGKGDKEGKDGGKW